MVEWLLLVLLTDKLSDRVKLFSAQIVKPSATDNSHLDSTHHNKTIPSPLSASNYFKNLLLYNMTFHDLDIIPKIALCLYSTWGDRAALVAPQMSLN